MALAQAQLGTGITTVYTSTGDSATVCMFFCNTDSSAVTIDVHIVANGDTADATNKIISSLSINAGDTYMMNIEKIVISNGDSVQALASTGSVVSCTVSYVNI